LADESFEFAGSARGQIDRIDVGPVSAFVTDYKSSRKCLGLHGSSGRQSAGGGTRWLRRRHSALVGLSVSLDDEWPIVGLAPELSARCRKACEDDGISEATELVSATEGASAEAVEGMRGVR
jgi:hypothetical protein